MASHDVSPFSGSPTNLGTSPNSTASGPAASGLGFALAHSATTSAAAPAKPKAKPRKRVNTAEKRNQHNAIERQRRETLNGKFVYLARLLPALAAHRRPSKSAIVNGSIAHLTHQREQRLLAARLLRQLCADRDALAKECAEWRFANGLPARDDLNNGKSAWSDEMEEVCAVEQEQFGTFAGMDDGAEGEGEGEGDDAEDDNNASSFGGSFSLPSVVHPQPQQQLFQQQQQQQQRSEMSLEQAAAIAGQAPFRSAPASTSNMMDTTSNTNALFGSQSNNPWAQLSLADLQAFAAATALTPAGLTPSTNGTGNMNRNGSISMGDSANGNSNGMFVPQSMSSSTASLPFNAFMSEDSVSPGSNSGYSQHIPTPPQTGSAHAFIASLPTVQQTPSPQSSHSLDEGMGMGLNMKSMQQQPQQQTQQQPQWTEQQLQLLRAIQQQQQQQQQPAFNPLSLFSANNAAAAFALGFGANSTGNNANVTSGSPTNADSPFNMFASVFPQSQLGNNGGNASFNLSNGSNGSIVPPPLTRAQTENLEAWRKMSAMPSAYRNSMGMGMSFDQLQQAQSRAVEGF